MKIIITGASGFIGKWLVYFFKKKNISLILVGRDKKILEKLFPDAKCLNYEELFNSSIECDYFIHLATINNSSSVPLDEFIKINSEMTLQLAKYSIREKIKYFFNFSSMHVMTKNSPYARSKILAIKKLKKLCSKKIVNFYLPSVYHDRWSGKLNILNYLPKIISNFVFFFISSLKPTIHLKYVAKKIVNFGDRHTENEIFFSNNLDNNIIYRIFKKSTDVIFCISIILLLSWLIIIVSILIKITSKGPILFMQKRVGKNKKVFTCYKFRTMYANTPELPSHHTFDSQVTNIGRLLRLIKIDELPQIINILRGEMTLIGPRPCLETQNELILERNNRGIYDILPGISGLAQINNIDMSNPLELAKTDERYLHLRGVMLDITLMIKTIIGKGSGDRTRKIKY